MKKGLSLFLVVLLSFLMLAGCTSNTQTETTSETPGTQTEEIQTTTTLRVGALKGPTAMGMVELMAENEAQETATNAYEFTLMASPDEITPLLAKGELDIAAVPANLASVLYQNTNQGVSVLAINTLGVIYIVENGDTIHSVQDLKGKTIYASGKGSTPEFGLYYILEENGLNPETDVQIEWKTEHAECVAALEADPTGIAMLPQPFVTTAQMQNENLRIALDLSAEWDTLQSGKENPSGMITGVVIARNDVITENPEAIALFLEQYAASVDYVNANNEEAAALIEKYDILAANVAQKALPYCNITCITGNEMQQKLSGYLNVLYEQNPKSVGGALPKDGFYYHGA